MIKIYFLILFTLFLNGCMNKHGISVKYYSDCKEYYDLQGYYYKECGKDDIISYDELNKELIKGAKKVQTLFSQQPKEEQYIQKNVW